jgi:ABC-2 type transport system permease protein
MTADGATSLPRPTTPASGSVMSIDAVRTLLGLSLQRIVRGRRLLLLSVMFLIPSVVAGLARHYNPTEDVSRGLLELLMFYMIPNALVPFSALMLGSGQIQDEVEDQTLTYLLIRPMPRWLIYLVKVVATTLVTAALTGVFTLVTLAAIYLNNTMVREPITPGFAFRMTALLMLASAAYSTVFTALGVFFKRAMVLGMGYIITFEGVFANAGLAIRNATIMYYTRVLAERWLGLHYAAWAINLDEAPTGTQALLILLGAMIVSTVAAAVRFTTHEWRLKTPEGN